MYLEDFLPWLVVMDILYISGFLAVVYTAKLANKQTVFHVEQLSLNPIYKANSKTKKLPFWRMVIILILLNLYISWMFLSTDIDFSVIMGILGAGTLFPLVTLMRNLTGLYQLAMAKQGLIKGKLDMSYKYSLKALAVGFFQYFILCSVLFTVANLWYERATASFLGGGMVVFFLAGVWYWFLSTRQKSTSSKRS